MNKIRPPIITVRKLTPHDLPGVMAIEKQQNFPWSEGQFLECLGSFFESLVVEIKEEGIIKIIGFVIVQVVADQAEILNFAVNLHYKRKGFGSMLLNHLLNRGTEQKLKRIYLEVRVGNLAAINLYEKFGFKRVGVRKDYYRAEKGREDAILMEYVYNGSQASMALL